MLRTSTVAATTSSSAGARRRSSRYHLAGESMEPRIDPTVHDLANRVRPRVVAPGHCTGWRAKAALAQTFAPVNYGPSVVGSLYALRAT